MCVGHTLMCVGHTRKCVGHMKLRVGHTLRIPHRCSSSKVLVLKLTVLVLEGCPCDAGEWAGNKLNGLEDFHTENGSSQSQTLALTELFVQVRSTAVSGVPV